jgi:hypothetical protein
MTDVSPARTPEEVRRVLAEQIVTGRPRVIELRAQAAG